jgi:hypothetical protein
MLTQFLSMIGLIKSNYVKKSPKTNFDDWENLLRALNNGQKTII